MTTAGSLPVPNNWINDNFGSKRGLFNYSLCELKRMAGYYSSLKVERNARPQRIVFVCVGNICRSPLAEAVAKSEGYQAVSYGLDTRGDDNADPRAVQIARKYDLDLSSHRTRRISDYMPKEGDLIVGMEPRHLKILRTQEIFQPFTLLGLFPVKKTAYIHDPYNTNGEYFTRCDRLIVTATKALIEHVQ